VGETACAQAGVEIADIIVTTMRKSRRFILSSVIPPAALDIRYEYARTTFAVSLRDEA